MGDMRGIRLRLQNEQGSILMLVVICSAGVGGLAYFMATRMEKAQKQLNTLTVKTQLVNDRQMILYDLVNRPLPTPTP